MQAYLLFQWQIDHTVNTFKLYMIVSFNPYSVGTVFIRQNPTSVDVRFWLINKIEIKYFQWP